MCGQPLDEDGYVRYLENTQVREIAEALSKVSEEVIRQRFDQKVSTQPSTYFCMEESYEKLLNLCCEVREFYNSAANQENAILISIV